MGNIIEIVFNYIQESPYLKALLILIGLYLIQTLIDKQRIRIHLRKQDFAVVKISRRLSIFTPFFVRRPIYKVIYTDKYNQTITKVCSLKLFSGFTWEPTKYL